jgi:glutaredoxin 3
MSQEVLIYTTPTCPHCIRAKRLLEEKHVSYREIDVKNDPKIRAFLLETSGRRTVPQIFIGGNSIGGCDELYALERDGTLDELLRDVR